MRRWVLALGLVMIAGPGRAIPVFTEVSAARGIGTYAMAPTMGGGVASSDYDADGDIDLFVPNAEGVPDQLYRNRGDGTFDEIAAAVGLASVHRSRSALWVDVDGDRDLDLVVAGDCFGTRWLIEPGPSDCTPGTPTRWLYHQEADGTFVDMTVASGLARDSGALLQAQHGGGLAAGDLDGDGDLDLVSAVWYGALELWRNDGGHFSPSFVVAGMPTTATAYWQPVVFDANGDRWPDIFVAVDFQANLLLVNQGDGTFVDQAAAAGVATLWNEMGVAVGDYDADGDQDLYATNIWEYEPGEHNVLFRNDGADGGAAFTEVGLSAGVGDTGWGWGTTFLDVDLDGWLDLVATNGYRAEEADPDATRLFRGTGPPAWAFADVSAASQVNDTFWGSALVAADLDRDGDLDLVQTTKDGGLRILDHGGVAGRQHLVVQPRRSDANHVAVGAVVRVHVGGAVQSRLIGAGSSFLGQEPAEAFFGVGKARRVDRVVVEWPDGSVSTRVDVPADQVLVVDGAPDPPARGTIGLEAGASTVGERDRVHRVRVVRTGDTSQADQVTIRSHDRTAKAPNDYRPFSRRVVLRPGVTSREIKLRLRDDRRWEPDELLHLALTDAAPDVLVDRPVMAVTILDDDPPPR